MKLNIGLSARHIALALSCILACGVFLIASFKLATRGNQQPRSALDAKLAVNGDLSSGVAHFTANYIGCPHKCNGPGGSCLNNICSCRPGFGGLGCKFSAKNFYGASDPFANLTTEGLAVRTKGAPSGLAPVLDAVFSGSHGPQLVVQLGCGRQVALDWGVRLQQRGGGLLLCVDYFLPSWADRVLSPAGGRSSAGGLAAAGAPLKQLLVAVQEAGLREWVVPLPGHPRDVLQALKALGAAPDVVSISGEGLDGGDRQELLDGWYRTVPAGGMMVVGHTAGVTAAGVGRFAAGVGASVSTINAFSLLVKRGAVAVAEGAAPAAPQLGPGALADCDPSAAALPAGWVPCNMNTIRVNTTTRTVHASFMDAAPWGNLLSPYYQGLAVAQLLGFRYLYESGFKENAWIQHLPHDVAPGLICPNASEVVRACQRCPGNPLWEFAHACDAGWTQARPAIRAVTRAAFESWVRWTGKTLPAFEPGDAVIQMRCAHDTLLYHGAYGPTAFSMYSTYLPPDTKRVFAIYAHHGHNGPAVYAPCDKLVDALGRYITQRRPGVTFGIIGGDKWEDFARLMYAPVAFRDSTSSFGLWATLANSGRVFSPHALAPGPALDSSQPIAYILPQVDATFRFVDVPVLFPAVAVSHNMSVGLKDQSPQIDKILAWLESN